MKKIPCPRLASIAFVALAVLLSGCSTRRAKSNVIPANFAPATVAEMSPVDPGLLQRPAFEYKLGPGDVLDIEVLGDVNTQASSVVGPDGKMYFYLLPGIDVWGLTLGQARERIVEGMQRLIREQQPVSLTLRKAENQRIWLLGRLNKPGIYSMAGPMTLLEALSEAGGPAPAGAFASMTGPIGVASSRGAADEAADLSRAFLIREGRMLRVDFSRLLREGDMSQNVYLQPNDFIYLPSATIGNVHVLGAVESPRALDYVNELTLIQAVSQAGGTLRRYAHLTQVAIVRGSLAQPQVAVVDMTAILAGQAPDIALQPQDIVFVPHTPYRVLTRYVDLILDTFVRTVGVNEGARAVDGRAQPLGVTVPLGPL
jgi:protein involved in polysaccharide export with SLBB domain